VNSVRVTVIDYGIGNLYSVRRAFEHCGAQVTFTSDAAGITTAERLVLPGVGAFADGMAGLREQGLVQPLRAYAASKRPLLGICLGMQMLTSVSEEFGLHAGLDLIPGRVVPISATNSAGEQQKIPNIGWSAIIPANGATWRGTPLEPIASGTPMYLVHSYHVVPSDPVNLLAQCQYGGRLVTTAIRMGKIFGFQFHPEKSGVVGLNVMAAFLRTAGA
jgi:imidazole glycerol-phosphate synthase subunit HisH